MTNLLNKKHEFVELYNNVKQNLFWFTFINQYRNNKKLLNHLVKREIFTILDPKELNEAIEKLKTIKYPIWEKSFWGLSSNESICFLASEKSRYIESLINGKNTDYQTFKEIYNVMK
jgi:hypothetical protein